MPSRAGRHLHHRKSRLGCQKCKERKVKCDEVRPLCGNCRKYGDNCRFDSVAPASCIRLPTRSSTSDQQSASEIPAESSASVLVNKYLSNQDRLLELRLMHHYTAVTSQEPLTASHDAAVVELYTCVIPVVALKYEPLLNAIFALAALHMYKLDPSITEYAGVHRRYFEAALMKQRYAVESITSENADGACLTATIITHLALSTRSASQDYEPPSLWLDLASTHHTLFKEAWDLILESSRLVCIIDAEPNLRQYWIQLRPNYPEIFPPDLEKLFPNILDFEDPLEVIDEERRLVYRFALGYVAHSLQHIEANEDPSKSRRRLLAFCAMAPSKYKSLVREHQARALIILACFFSIVKAVDNIWWLRGIPEREVLGIQSILPDRWQWEMAWPIQKLALFTAAAIPAS